jgi:subfamily B ATP-binding cassette protein HlyB/CyaB
LLHEFGEDAWDTQRILLAAQSLGMQAKAVAQDPERYDKAPLPAVGQLKSGDFFIVAKFNPGTENLAAKLLIQLPGEPPSLRQGYLGIC